MQDNCNEQTGQTNAVRNEKNTVEKMVVRNKKKTHIGLFFKAEEKDLLIIYKIFLLKQIPVKVFVCR
mgnify:CR=1 FL=1|jgi:hypothetical protein